MSDPGELGSNSSSSPGAKQSISKRFSAHLHGEVDTKEIGWISVYACFLTGFTSSHSFSACFIWCGFQTGNVAQLGLALARTFNPEPYRTFGFQKADQQALCSLLTFLLGTSLGRLGDKIGPKKRIWLITTALVQSLLGMAAALAAHYSDQAGISTAREEPSWTNALGFTALGFLSATMGIQGIVGKRLASPLNTTIVLTTTWVELINDPSLFSLRFTHSRDIRIAGVAMILLGAFVARAILGSAGSAGSIGVMVAFRLIQMVWWGCIKGSAPKVKS